MPNDADAIYRAARDLPESEQTAYLESACGDDAALRAAVHALLQGEGATGRVSPSDDPDRTIVQTRPSGLDRAPDHEDAGQVIGRYTLLRPLGEGGFGTVWLAQQHEPVRRQVALKIIKLGMDTRQVIARFEAERQALALMDHPNIAKVFDAGTTDTGRPYFVMEHVDGIPFTEYCDKSRTGIRARLQLFQRVCLAVQHAHQKGIIHRDIKPNNVLVTTVDGEPSPKVIDFGIAKATEARLTEHSMFTEHGQFIGTPAYMSPEQAGQTGEDIDTRSDIYALGVLLYEILTGETPFDPRTLLRAGIEEIRRIIREEDPPKPSTRLSKLGASIGSVAELRDIDSRKLNALLLGDVDWIVMKAMEKDRSRRYQTASGFAEDIDRFLRHEPVLASPPSARYRLGKFVRRHRSAVTAGLLLLAALLAGTVGTSVGLVRATRAERIAVQAADAAEDARRQEAEQRRIANEQADVARTERDKAEQVAAFLTDMLGGVDAQVAQGADTTLLRGILSKTAERVGEELSDQPEVEAVIRSQLGITYLKIRDFETADEHLQRSLELYQQLHPHDHPDAAQGIDNLGALRYAEERHEESAALHGEALDMYRRLQPGDSSEMAGYITNLANTLVRLSRYEEAEQLLLDAMEMNRRLHGETHVDVAVGLNSLANLKQLTNEYEAAEDYYRQALSMHRELLGEGHPYVATDLHNLGFLLANIGENAKAIERLEDALARGRALYPDGHEQIASCLVLLGQLYRYDDERSDESVEMFEEAIELNRRLYGKESRPVARALLDLGRVLRDQRKYEASIERFQEAATLYERLYGPQHNDVAVCRQGLAGSLAKLGRFEEASTQYDLVLEAQTALFGEAHEEPAITLCNIGRMHKQAGDLDAAEARLREALDVLNAVGLERSAHSASCYEQLGQIQRERGDLAASAELLREALAVRRETSGPDSRNVLGASYALAGTLIEIAEFDEAEALLTRCLEDPKGVIDLLTRAHIQRRYANLLAEAERYDECVDTLEQCYDVFAQLSRATDTVTIETLQELVRVNELRHELDPGAGFDIEAARWRTRLEQGE